MKKLAFLPLAALALGACADRVDPLAVVPGEEPRFSTTTTSLGTLTQITESNNVHGRAEISGNRIVYTAGDHVYLYETSTGLTIQISEELRGGSRPSISGDFVAWADGCGPVVFPCNDFLVVYDISTGARRYISDAWGNSAISGDRVVHSSMASNVWMYDYSTGGSSRQITNSNNVYGRADISGNLVVYSAGGLVHLHDVSTWQASAISEAGLSRDNPSISGNLVAWEARCSPGEQNCESGIGVHDIGNGHTRYVDALGSSPAVSGNRVAYTTETHGVWMYDYSARETTQIAQTGPGVEAVISGHRIVWVDGGNLYLFDYFLATHEQVEEISASVDHLLTSGEIAHGAAASLTAFTSQTLAALARDNERAAVNTLNAMIRYANAQSGKQITVDAAAMLIEMAESAIASL